jgi:hypothetical protein
VVADTGGSGCTRGETPLGGSEEEKDVVKKHQVKKALEHEALKKRRRQ